MPAPTAARAASTCSCRRDYEGEVPDGYFVFRSSTYRNWVMVRGSSRSPGGARPRWRTTRSISRSTRWARACTSRASSAPSFKEGDTTHPRDIRYFERLDKMVQYEPLSAFTAEELGLLRALGIVKGASSSSRTSACAASWRTASKLGDGMAKAIAFASRDPEARVYPDRHWERIFIGGYKFERDGARLPGCPHALPLHRHRGHPGDGGSRWSASARSTWRTYKDASGAYLDGGQNYRLKAAGRNPRQEFLVGDGL